MEGEVRRQRRGRCKRERGENRYRRGGKKEEGRMNTISTMHKCTLQKKINFCSIMRHYKELHVPCM